MKVSFAIWLVIGALGLLIFAVNNLTSAQGASGAFKSDYEWVADETHAMLEDEFSVAEKADFCLLLASDSDFQSFFKAEAVESTSGVDLSDAEIGTAALNGAQKYCS